MEVSKNYIVDIRTFLNDYYGFNYSSNKKLSHNFCEDYLKQKGIILMEVKVAKVKKEDILSGRLVFVKDEYGQVLAYKNPLRLGFKLERLKKKTLKERRLKVLNEQGFTYDENGKVKKYRIIGGIK